MNFMGKDWDTLQKSLTKFNKELSHWLQPTLTNPDEEQINIIKQYSSIAFHIFGGDSFYKIAFNLYLLLSANDYHKPHTNIQTLLSGQ
jgi:hypothetical protein